MCTYVPCALQSAETTETRFLVLRDHIQFERLKIFRPYVIISCMDRKETARTECFPNIIHRVFGKHIFYVVVSCCGNQMCVSCSITLVHHFIYSIMLITLTFIISLTYLKFDINYLKHCQNV